MGALPHKIMDSKSSAAKATLMTDHAGGQVFLIWCRRWPERRYLITSTRQISQSLRMFMAFLSKLKLLRFPFTTWTFRSPFLLAEAGLGLPKTWMSKTWHGRPRHPAMKPSYLDPEIVCNCLLIKPVDVYASDIEGNSAIHCQLRMSFCQN